MAYLCVSPKLNRKVLMPKIDKVVLKETRYIALWVLALSVIMELIFLIINMWDITVLLGNVLSAFVTVLNFLLMGIGVQKAVSQDEKGAKQTMKVSQMLRMLMLLIAAVLGVYLSVFNTWAVLIPLFFPRIAILVRPFFDKSQNTGKENENAKQ